MGFEERETRGNAAQEIARETVEMLSWKFGSTGYEKKECSPGFTDLLRYGPCKDDPYYLAEKHEPDFRCIMKRNTLAKVEIKSSFFYAKTAYTTNILNYTAIMAARQVGIRYETPFLFTLFVRPENIYFQRIHRLKFSMHKQKFWFEDRYYTLHCTNGIWHDPRSLPNRVFAEYTKHRSDNIFGIVEEESLNLLLTTEDKLIRYKQIYDRIMNG